MNVTKYLLLNCRFYIALTIGTFTPVLVASGEPANGDEAHLVQHQDSDNTFTPGYIFQDKLSDGSPGPTMVVIPPGQFYMGSYEGEPDHEINELPLHEVKFANAFAVGRTEVTVGEFAKFVYEYLDPSMREVIKEIVNNIVLNTVLDKDKLTKLERLGSTSTISPYNSSFVWDEQGQSFELKKSWNYWRTDYLGNQMPDNYPVVNVNWETANDYAKWLAKETGKPYRLLSEAEFDYVNRAGSTTDYPWGDGPPPPKIANIAGGEDQPEDSKLFGEVFEDYEDGFVGPAPVASFAPNAFGLYDITGNVSEWIQDCYFSSYVGAPPDGTAYEQINERGWPACWMWGEGGRVIRCRSHDLI